MRIQNLVIVFIIALSSCTNPYIVSNEHLLKIEKTLLEGVIQLENDNRMIEGVIRNEIWDRSYPHYDSIEIVMDTIINEFMNIENEMEKSFSLNPREELSLDQIEKITSFYSIKIDKIEYLYSNFIRNNHLKYDLNYDQAENMINEINQGLIQVFLSKESYIYQRADGDYDFRPVLIKIDILNQKNKILENLNYLIKRPCLVIEQQYPIILNAYRTYELSEEATIKIAIGSYVGGTQKNIELFIDGKRIKEYIDGHFQYDLPTDIKGNREISFRMIKTNPITGEVSESTGKFVYEVE